jgi:lipopolysaccharide/colanic/teichoic acid biosynthesis glycosyltransferase
MTVTALEAVKQEQAKSTRPAVTFEPAFSVPDRGWRRWWQVAIAAGGLLALAPVALLIAVVTKLTSRGPVLYRGTRIGRELRPFTILKFRTLMVDAEQRIGARLLTPADTLYTPIGRFLKKYKLDEIPQLLNVVKGDMNLVGPRPIRPIFLATSMREIANYRSRFAVRPGMTGLAQLRGGYFTDPRDKLRYDMIYIRHRAFWLDVRLVVATFVKLANRWLTLGLLLGLMFFCASFVPQVFRGPFEFQFGGFSVSPFEAFGLLVAGFLLARQIPSHRLYLYRTPTNWPMTAFVAVCLLAPAIAGDLAPRLRDLAYFTASGFLLFFLVVSGEITDEFATWATRIVALFAVAVSLLGILTVVVQTHADAGGLASAVQTGRVTTLGNPVVLAAYLVLGMPLVLCELAAAERREERDFWLICATLVVVGVLLTQTRTGLVALWVTGSIFCWRLSRRTAIVFAGVTLVFVATLVATGKFGLSPAALGEQWTRRAGIASATFGTQPDLVDVLVGSEPGKGANSVVEVAGEADGITRLAQNANMHLTLLRRTGILGWAAMMWVIGAALLAIGRGSQQVADPHLGRLLWAILSSGVGFVVSMSGFNAFYSPVIQMFFWGLLGFGMAIVTHRAGRRPAFNVIWRFGAGD